MNNQFESFADSYLKEEHEDKETWKIDNDVTADWAIEKIKEIQAEYARLENVYNAKIEQIKHGLQQEKDKMERDAGYFEGKLREYFYTLKDAKETKTQKSYKLPSGTLKLSKPKFNFEYDKNKLLEVAEKNEELKVYIKNKPDFAWGEFKKKLVINGSDIINKETGEVIKIDGLSVVERSEVFKVDV